MQGVLLIKFIVSLVRLEVVRQTAVSNVDCKLNDSEIDWWGGSTRVWLGARRYKIRCNCLILCSKQSFLSILSKLLKTINFRTIQHSKLTALMTVAT